MTVKGEWEWWKPDTYGKKLKVRWVIMNTKRSVQPIQIVHTKWYLMGKPSHVIFPDRGHAVRVLDNIAEVCEPWPNPMEGS